MLIACNCWAHDRRLLLLDVEKAQMLPVDQKDCLGVCRLIRSGVSCELLAHPLLVLLDGVASRVAPAVVGAGQHVLCLVVGVVDVEEKLLLLLAHFSK